MTDCVFCKIVDGDLPAYKIYEDGVCFAFLDINPVNRGHVLLIPKDHYRDLLGVPESIMLHLSSKVKFLAPKILLAVNAIAFNLIINNGTVAGQAVPHLHYHIIPRFEDDNLHHWPGKAVADNDLLRLQAEIKSII